MRVKSIDGPHWLSIISRVVSWSLDTVAEAM